MINYFLKKIYNITSLNRNYRKVILIMFDFILISISLIISILLSNPTSFHSDIYQIIIINIVCSAFGITLYSLTGHYKSLMFYFGMSSLYSILIRNILFLVFINIYIYFFSNFKSLLLLNLIFLITLSLLILLSRLILRDLFRLSVIKFRSTLKKVFIYGAGSAGAQLEAALRLGGKYEVKGFVDDSSKLWYRYLNGIKIYPPEFLNKSLNIDNIFVAIPSLSNFKRSKLLSELQKKSIPIYQIPSIEDIASGKEKIDYLKPIEIEDLLSREKVLPKSNLLSMAIKKNVICITGGAGSIGGELCKQIQKLNPRKIIIIDNSEHNLYLIKQILSSNNKDIIIKYVLGDVSSSKFVQSIFTKFNIDILFHAAAYKHVPLVEENPIEGLRNNVFSTKIICEAALTYGLKKVILISSDKAVRPTNIMGASKRLSEMIIQAFAKEVEDNPTKYKYNTKFSMVRFGNVLNSSGSVVPLFKKQIAKGGPVTITHSKVIRYFMMIDEAAQLVLQTSIMSKGGEVFLLDMGKPVSIFKLAKQMIKLSGFEVKDTKNPNGDIEIKTIGLRPGEKLYEELLINGEALPTEHPLIFKAKEMFIDKKELYFYLDNLFNLMYKNDEQENLKKILVKLVPEWKGDLN